MAVFEALMSVDEGSYLKQGSRPAILIVIIDDRVPSKAKLFLVLVMFSPTTENTHSASALEWGRTRTSLAMLASLWNWPTPVTFEESNAYLLCNLKTLPYAFHQPTVNVEGGPLRIMLTLCFRVVISAQKLPMPISSAS